MKRLLLDYNPFCVRAALVEDKTLIDFWVEHSSMRGLVGNIYKGKVVNVLSGMKAAFVNIGLERNGFLYVGETLVDAGRTIGDKAPTSLNVSAGDVIMCQVVKDQFGNKGARLTTEISIPGYFLVLLPNSSFFGVSKKIESDERREYLQDLVKSICPQNNGFIIRSAADKASNEDIIAEANKLFGIWKKIEDDYKKATATSCVFRDAVLLERAIRDTLSEEVEEVVVNDSALAKQLEGKFSKAEIKEYVGERNIFFAYGITEQVNKLSDRRVNLENGAYLVIDKTEALTVIDVNTGRFVGGKDLEDTVYKTNIIASKEIAKQLRLRNIGGIVVVDYIDMTNDEHKEGVLSVLREELKKDHRKTSAVEMTALGLVELTRKKTSLPTDSFMLEPCKECMGGKMIAREQLVFSLRDDMIEYSLTNAYDTILVKVHPDVFDTVFSTHLMRRELATIWNGKRVYFVPDGNLKRGEHTFEGTCDKILTLPSTARLLR